MKYALIIAFIILGIILLILGYFMRIMHWPYASILYYLGQAITIIALILTLIKTFKSNR
jgi:hypothetical protein